MTWIWQHHDWPHFRYDRKALAIFENDFLQKAGFLYGAMRHIGAEDQKQLTIQLMSEEALKTSEIEGEILDRQSVQSSIQRQFGLKPPQRKIAAAEQGISDMMVDLYNGYDAPLNHDTLFGWHKMLTDTRRDLRDIGQYRTHAEPMQIISNRLGDVQVHYEAPPSKSMKLEMAEFLKWFNDSRHPTTNAAEYGALARSGIAHLYFESIHPFEDGNGRIGRAVSEKSLSQSLNRPTLIALSHIIGAHKKDYYAALQRNSSGDIDITDWLLFFAKTILDAQTLTQSMVDFLIGKVKFYDRFAGQLNERQEKVIARMFHEGPQGFEGGLSADNYIRITNAPRATVTRDLQDMVKKGALIKTGELRYTRYQLALNK